MEYVMDVKPKARDIAIRNKPLTRFIFFIKVLELRE